MVLISTTFEVLMLMSFRICENKKKSGAEKTGDHCRRRHTKWRFTVHTQQQQRQQKLSQTKCLY